ncbi:MAG: DUF3788 domain-containing protein, partial [Marinilabiliales bacterium]|nr:DUF3788 domain-containing protein [Marinilabiliales bacterium]
RFYNDGKCWLFRVLHKKDTVCWIGVEKETFRVSVSIHEKWADVIEASELPEDCKLQFRTARVFNHTRSITVVIRDEQDAQTVLALTALKLKYKG